MIAADEYQAFYAADKAWSTELQRLFGHDAGDMRYRKEGCTGPTLGPLHAELLRTAGAWQISIERERAELAKKDLPL